MNTHKHDLIIFGSPHTRGFTAKTLKRFLVSRNDKSNYIFYNCYQKNVSPCVDCKYCRRNYGCKYNDMDDIYQLLSTADKIIFATPIYNLSFPSPMKAVIDRMQCFYSARFFMDIKPAIKKHKEGSIIITCGSENEFGVEVVKKQIQQVCSVINCTIKHEVVVKQTDDYDKS